MAEQVQGAEGMRLLLVDDEERFRTTLAKRMQEKGIDVNTLDSGISALQYIQDYPVDVIVLDIKMPDMDGIETLNEIKKIKSGIEVILLTGHAAVDSAIEGMRLGAYDYLMKPCELEDLLEKILGAYKIKHARDVRLQQAEERSRLDRLEKSVRF
ncbi:MAG: response regulator [Desulfovibrionales bacterium]|nr:MAG: response regulator [Desulfovibrionales bacterium]